MRNVKDSFESTQIVVYVRLWSGNAFSAHRVSACCPQSLQQDLTRVLVNLPRALHDPIQWEGTIPCINCLNTMLNHRNGCPLESSQYETDHVLRHGARDAEDTLERTGTVRVFGSYAIGHCRVCEDAKVAQNLVGLIVVQFPYPVRSYTRQPMCTCHE